MSNQIHNQNNFSKMKINIENIDSLLNKLQLENKKLKKSNLDLEKEIINLSNNIKEKDSTLSELTQILESLKIKEKENESKILELENENKELNYKILELNQKNKSFSEIINKNDLLKDKNYTELIQLNEKLEQIEIIKQKIEFDNKILKTKINDIQNQNENEIKLISKLKNGEISQLKKTILSLNEELNKKFIEKEDMDNNLNNNDLNLNNNENIKKIIEEIYILENKINILNEENYNLKKENKYLLNKKDEYELINEHKDLFINELQNKISKIEEKYNIKINDIKINSQNKNNQIEKLLIERDNLRKQNNKFKNEFELFNINIIEANKLYNKKTQSFSNIINNCIFELNHYKKQIYILKNKINQLIRENIKLKKQNNLNEVNLSKEKLSINTSLSLNKENNYLIHSARDKKIQNPNLILKTYKNNFIKKNNVLNLSDNNENNFYLTKKLSNNKLINHTENNQINDSYLNNHQRTLSELKKILKKVDNELIKTKKKEY